MTVNPSDDGEDSDDRPLDARDRKFFEIMAEDDCKYYEALYNNTMNPLYVWRAISVITALKFLDGDAYLSEFKIPRWCIEYLHFAASNLHDLAILRDIRKPLPQDYPDLSEPEINSDEAPRLTATALGLTTRGKSAFRDYRADTEAQSNKELFQMLRRSGLSERAAVDEMLSQTGLHDERSFRRRLSAAQRLKSRTK